MKYIYYVCTVNKGQNLNFFLVTNIMGIWSDYIIAQQTSVYVGLICSVHNILLLLYHTIKIIMYTKENKQKNGRKPNKIMLASILVLFMFVLFPFFSGYLNGWGKHNNLDCKNIILIAVLLYTYSKIMLYVFLFERLFFIFNETSIHFSKTFVYIIRLTCIIVFISTTVGSIFVIDGQSTLDNSIYPCKTNYSGYLNILFGLLDVFASYVILLMFSRKLLIMEYIKLEVNVEMSSTNTMTPTDPSNPTVSTTDNKVKVKSVLQGVTYHLLKRTVFLTFIALS